MASVLDFERYSPDLVRQLLRRIGYTNGLHKIFRFPRIVEYLYSVMPASVRAFTEVIIEKENALADSGPQLKGRDYAKGIVDVAVALELIERFGPKLALSSVGYGCHALSACYPLKDRLTAFMMSRVIACDGEYTLNILRLIDEGVRGAEALGEALIARFLELINFKLGWASSGIENRYAQQVITKMLLDAQGTLKKALSKGRAVPLFYKHIVTPRVEWLADLGCVAEEDKTTTVTPVGQRLLEASMLHRSRGFVVMPLDGWLATQLAVPNIIETPPPDLRFWDWVAYALTGRMDEYDLNGVSEGQLLGDIKKQYPCVKLLNFNEADALSIYQVFAADAAVRGTAVSEAAFESALLRLVQTFPGEIFKLSRRRGRGIYIALKKPS